MSLKSAHVGNMDPIILTLNSQVVVQIWSGPDINNPDNFVWKSEIKMDAGRDPKYDGPLATFKYPVKDRMARVRIALIEHVEIKDTKDNHEVVTWK